MNARTRPLVAAIAPALRRAVPLVLVAIVAAMTTTACNLDLSTRAEARDQWKRSYTLTKDGAFELRNTNGRVRIVTTEGNAVEVTAERSVKAANDEAAKQALASFEIAETVAPDRILIDSTNRPGITIGLQRQAHYTIRLPRWANVTVRETNGDIEISGLTGTFRAEATNGRIEARDLENSATVETTNGDVSLGFAKLGSAGVTCETTNGRIHVTIPRNAQARLSARVTNGTIHTDNLTVAASEQSRRRLEGTVGGGDGPSVRLSTTNGEISVSGK